MTGKTLHNITWIPMALLGLGAVALGLVWFFSSEPWLLDQVANEQLLQVTFENLFKAEINQNLSDYLTLSYRFFGWWIISLGLLIIAYTLVTRLGTPLAQNTIHGVLFIILAGISWIIKTWLSSSPFIWVVGLMWLLWLVSTAAAIGLRRVA